MIDQDRKATPDQHHYKNKVEEVAVTQPQRKSVGTRKIAGIDLRDSRNIGQPNSGYFHPCHEYREECECARSLQERWPDPDMKPPIGRMMNGGMNCIKADHFII